MPRGDGTGRLGMGPLTGRAMGYCAGYPQPGYGARLYAARGLGCRCGWGLGRGFGFATNLAPVDVGSLHQRASVLEQELALVKEIIAKQQETEAK